MLPCYTSAHSHAAMHAVIGCRHLVAYGQGRSCDTVIPTPVSARRYLSLTTSPFSAVVELHASGDTCKPPSPAFERLTQLMHMRLPISALFTVLLCYGVLVLDLAEHWFYGF